MKRVRELLFRPKERSPALAPGPLIINSCPGFSSGTDVTYVTDVTDVVVVVVVGFTTSGRRQL
ncbi:hypothetical protein OAO87_02800 [bacterium]|nr:hypothetical protein [bacterium]